MCLRWWKHPRDTDGFSTGPRSDRIIDNHPLHSLVIRKHTFHPFRMTQLVSMLAQFVRLEVRHIPRETVIAIAQTCKNMDST